jgi:signal recognition particle subunit SRP54
MTPFERKNPDLLSGSRKKRIADGSGRGIQEVNQLLKQFDGMRKMMKTMNKMQQTGRALSMQNLKRR